MIECTCPKCGALLRNVDVEPGRPVRCSNCAHAFQADAHLPPADPLAPVVPPAAGTEVEPASIVTVVPDEDIPAPKAHYGFLTIAGAMLMLTCFAGGTTLGLTKLPAWLQTSAPRLGDAWVPGLVFGLPLLGLLAFLITLRVGWLDGHLHRLAAMLGARVGRMPTATGSNLPFILPWMVSGALAVMGPLALLLLQDEQGKKAALAIPAGALLFALGLALGELRRFFARLSWAADRVTLAQPRQEAPIATMLRMGLELLTPYTMLLAALSAGILALMALWDAIRGNDDLLICPLSALTLATVGGAYSIFRLSKELVIVVAKSERMARLLNLNRSGAPFTHQHSLIAFALSALPSLWVWCLTIQQLSVNRHWIRELPGMNGLNGLLLTAGLLAAALWFGGLLLLLHRALGSVRAIVECTVPAGEAWPLALPWPKTLTASLALLLALLVASVFLLTSRELFDSTLLGISVLGAGTLVLIMTLGFQYAGLVEVRGAAVALALVPLTFLAIFHFFPKEPTFMLVTGGSLGVIAFAFLVIDVERLAARIEAARG